MDLIDYNVLINGVASTDLYCSNIAYGEQVAFNQKDKSTSVTIRCDIYHSNGLSSGGYRKQASNILYINVNFGIYIIIYQLTQESTVENSVRSINCNINLLMHRGGGDLLRQLQFGGGSAFSPKAPCNVFCFINVCHHRTNDCYLRKWLTSESRHWFPRHVSSLCLLFSISIFL